MPENQRRCLRRPINVIHKGRACTQRPVLETAVLFSARVITSSEREKPQMAVIPQGRCYFPEAAQRSQERCSREPSMLVGKGGEKAPTSNCSGSRCRLLTKRASFQRPRSHCRAGLMSTSRQQTNMQYWDPSCLRTSVPAPHTRC
jgi:hypothetical protein